MLLKVVVSNSTVWMKSIPINMTGNVCPTFMVPGMRSSGTIFAARNQAVVGAKLPIPRESKKLVTKPIALW